MNDRDAPTPDDFKKAAMALIAGETTLTLSTCGSSGPWSAPVYYVFVNGGFYFFSSPDSRHIRQALTAGKAAASLFHPADDWQDIRGIQMSGTVTPVRSVAQSMKVIAFYLHRFPFTREFFPDNEKPDLNAFFRQFKVRLYVFTPKVMFYVDNRFGFGNRRQISGIDKALT